MSIFDKVVYDTIYNSAPIILCVLGGIFAHKANVLNIGLEGMMTLGAFSSVLFTLITGNYWLGILVSILLTIVLGLVFSFMSITLKGNVIIVGIAINLIAASLAAFVMKVMGKALLNASNIVDVAALQINIPIVKDIPVIGPLISGHTLITYLSFIGIFLMWVLMYKTRFGVYVRVVGESEGAARSVGINVNRIKYLAVLIGSVCCAFAGANLAVERMALFTSGMVAGRGFIAIAAIFCGAGRPGLSAIYAIAFGLAKSLSINLNMYAGDVAGLFETLPYLMIVIILSIASVIKYRNNRVRGFKNEQ